MKIPFDFFLRLIEKMLNELELENISKKLKKYFESPEDDYNDILSSVDLKVIIKKFIEDNKEIKKKLKAKTKKLEKENKKNEEEEDKVEEEKEEKKFINKKRKASLASAGSINKEEKKSKRKASTSASKEKNEKPKRKRTMSSTAKEEKSKRKRTMSINKDEEDKSDNDNAKDNGSGSKSKNKNKKKKKNNDDDDIDLEKEVVFIPQPKTSNPDRIPFKRIDESKTIAEVPKGYRDNSYATYMKQTGDDFGKAANEKLIATRGKGFRKEKNKFKNKSFHGGVNISTTVRSIKLEDDTSSDEE